MTPDRKAAMSHRVKGSDDEADRSPLYTRRESAAMRAVEKGHVVSTEVAMTERGEEAVRERLSVQQCGEVGLGSDQPADTHTLALGFGGF